jgi:long-subunit acyl-CoA synthetase (AMP-forming)
LACHALQHDAASGKAHHQLQRHNIAPLGVHLERDEWELGGEFITPSFKLKRAHLQRYYKRELDAMYQQLHMLEEQKQAAREQKQKNAKARKEL